MEPAKTEMQISVIGRGAPPPIATSHPILYDLAVTLFISLFLSL